MELRNIIEHLLKALLLSLLADCFALLYLAER